MWKKPLRKACVANLPSALRETRFPEWRGRAPWPACFALVAACVTYSGKCRRINALSAGCSGCPQACQQKLWKNSARQARNSEAEFAPADLDRATPVDVEHRAAPCADASGRAFAAVLCRLSDASGKMSPDQWLGHRVLRMSTSLTTKNVEKSRLRRCKRRIGAAGRFAARRCAFDRRPACDGRARAATFLMRSGKCRRINELSVGCSGCPQACQQKLWKSGSAIERAG